MREIDGWDVVEIVSVMIAVLILVLQVFLFLVVDL